LGEIPQISCGTLLASREPQGFPVLAESREQGRFPDAPSAVDGTHVEAWLICETIERLQLIFATNKYHDYSFVV
jgi:AAA+ superfamily predicted ATPase